MPNINLIAQKRQDKRLMERTIRRLFFLMSGLFIAAIALFTLMSAQWFSIRNRTNDLNDELAKLQPTIKLIQEVDNKTALIAPKIQLYGKARDHTLRWYTYLQVVARSLPENTWLTRVVTATPPAQNTGGGPPPSAIVNLSGVTMSQQLVGETMLNLSRYRDVLEAVNLHFTQKGEVGNTPTVEFEMATNIKGLESTFVAEKPAESNGNAETGGTNANTAKS